MYPYLQGGKGGEKRGRETSMCGASHMPPTGDMARNPRMCPNRESNWQPFSFQTGTQSTEPHQPGLLFQIFIFPCLSLFFSSLFYFPSCCFFFFFHPALSFFISILISPCLSLFFFSSLVVFPLPLSSQNYFCFLQTSLKFFFLFLFSLIPIPPTLILAHLMLIVLCGSVSPVWFLFIIIHSHFFSFSFLSVTLFSFNFHLNLIL